MRITIDNLDGAGPRDYSGDVVAANAKGGSSLQVQRGLNVPSRCTAEVAVGAENLPLPVRRARVVVSAADGTLLFTGYLATEPVQVYAGETHDGVVYRARLSAVSDEWLLDKLGPASSDAGGVSLELDGRALLARLVSRVNGSAGLLQVAESGAAVQTVGAYAAGAAAVWSRNASEAASAAYAGYRALDGQVMLQPAGAVVHVLSDDSLEIAELQTANVRELTNDVTLSGEVEPAAYVSEVFTGDGSTTIFELSEAAFRGTNSSRTIVQDSFGEASFDATQWVVNDPGSHLSLTAAGLTMNGGNGLDGQTTLTALDTVEMGGSVVVQMSGVVLGASSAGLLGGMYAGPTALANCFVGFRVRQNAGVTVLIPVVNGSEVGAVFTPEAGHSYTLRLRLHCVEMQRVAQRYACMVDGVVQSFGSASGVPAPMDAVFELVDEGAASNTPATVLYDSAAVGAALSSTPATCAFVAVNAEQMFGSVAAISVTRPGSMWVVSTLPSGVKQTRLVGTAGAGVDCEVSYGSTAGASGKVTFFAGRVPVAGERVTVMYRGSRRAVARIADAANVAVEATTGIPGTSRWLGKVLQPAARSSVDCESAAQAVLAFGTSRSAAIAGTCAAVNPAEDIWPGDVLRVTSAGVTTALMVRSVAIADGGLEPEVRRYKITFANDWATEWADGLGLRLSEAVAADAVLPDAAASGPGLVLANLQGMQVTALSETTLQLDAGMDPPAGGGFEVRRRDAGFGPGGDADLVMRSPVRSFSIARAAQVERFYVRVYDASVPPVYSRFSSAVFVDTPVG